MKDKLRSVLLNYIDNLNKNVDNLNQLLNEIETNEEKLNKVEEIYNLFIEKNERNILNFDKLSKEKYEYIIEDFKVNPELKEKTYFQEDDLSYEGVIYLVKGINEKIPLTLTDNQKEEINKFIDSLENQIEYYNKLIKESKDNIQELEYDSLDILKTHLEKYNQIVKDLDNDNYISDVEEIKVAMDKNDFLLEDVIQLLSFLLKYNAEIYENNLLIKEQKENLEILEEIEEPIEEENIEELEETEPFEESNENIEEESIDESNEKEILIEEDVHEEEKIIEDELEKTEEFDLEEINKNHDDYLINEEEKIEENIEEIEIPTEENLEEESIIDENDIPVVEEVMDDTLTSERLKEILEKNSVIYDNFEKKEELLQCEKDNLEEVLSYLKENKYINIFTQKYDILKKILLTSNIESLRKIIYIVENDLSVDKEDSKQTLNTLYLTMPAIFIDKNIENVFIDNVSFYKNLKLDLMKLYDNHREVYLADTKQLEENYQIIKKYNFNINESNVKYLLMLNNIDQKLDYYVSLKINDPLTNKEFDGNKLIKQYPAKLNTVCDTTIKRAYKAKESNRKVMGSKENSLAGEITNLKVDIINIDDEFNKKFLNNEFINISKEKVEEYKKYLSEKDYRDNIELENIKKYINENRYIINNTIISKPKFDNIYNNLRSKNVSVEEAIEFALGYNTIIEKNDFEKTKDIIIKEVK